MAPGDHQGVAARGKSPTAFDLRCIPADGVARRSNMFNILPPRALSARRLAGLGATRDFHHGLLAMSTRDSGESSAGNRDSKYTADKSERVRQVFDTASNRYDLMNDLMSIGLHRPLKRLTLEQSGVRAGFSVLDLAGGTGDFTRLFARAVGAQGRVVLADANERMLERGRDRLLDQGVFNVDYCLATAERLPFASKSFDCIVCGFGLRNFSDQERAISECRRVLRPGAPCLILEFSRPKNASFAQAFRLYRSTWPWLGKLIVGDSEPYAYLVESIEQHPTPEAVELMLSDGGFKQVNWHSLLGGVVTLHRACA